MIAVMNGRGGKMRENAEELLHNLKLEVEELNEIIEKVKGLLDTSQIRDEASESATRVNDKLQQIQKEMGWER